MRHDRIGRYAGILAGTLGLGLLVAVGSGRAATDDIFLIQASTSPNVVLLMDNSKSMAHIEWHPAFDPNQGGYGCDSNGLNCCEAFDPDTVYEYSSQSNENHCGNARKIWAPGSQGPPSALWDGRYLNWYFSDEADPYYNEIQTAKAEVEGCTQSGGGKFFDDKYRRTRFEAAKQVLLDLLCVAEPKNVRFGVALYRETEDVGDEDPNGGFVASDLGRSNPNHAAELESAIKTANLNDDDVEATPLSESLFQIYSFWMSRDLADIPEGIDGITPFPRYQYAKDGDWETNSTQWTEDPMLFDCEKAFVVVVTDGAPTRDDFDTELTLDEGTGFATFGQLIGDYHADGETEVPGDADESSWYLDDIAKYMYDKDFRPDLGGDQTIDTYTVGLATDAATDAFLEKTAQVGNGLFFHVQDGDELAFALIAALNDIIEKAASFTAATVPSARTIDGGDFYQTFFFPRGKSAFWEGHIRAWKINAAGEILDEDGSCALDDPDAGECNSGPFKPEAAYFWDAAEEVPHPNSRTLYTSTSSASSGSLPPAFDDGLQAADLGVATFTSPPDHAPNDPLYAVFGSSAVNEEGLADEIVQYARGCFFGTGVQTADVSAPLACLARPSRLGDIFHSNPVVVQHPRLFGLGPSYLNFRDHYEGRTRVIYAGTNAGFLEAFHAGDWDGAAVPPRYDEGTGEELFGFMPWESRQTIRHFPIDPATDRHHYVDGDAGVGDVWFYPTATTAAKATNGSEWHSVLVGSMREGGHQYFALDVTNPDGISPPGGGTAIPYPAYLWEFPTEADPDGDLDLMGETWGRAVVTRVRLSVNGNDNGGAGFERWVAIVAGGYDGAGDPNPTDVTGLASDTYDDSDTVLKGRSIFMLDVQTGEVIAEKSFDSGATDAQADMEYALVGTPAVFDLNFDGFADVIYFMDLGGQVFKWVVKPVGHDRANDSTSLRTQPNWPFKLFFQAPVETISGTDFYKNFYFPPAGALVSGKLWLAFGSGERRSLPFLGVANEDENNRFYVVTDPDPLELLASPLGTVTESDLTDITGDEDGATFTNRGYFFTVGDGEKFVTNVEIFAGQVIASSFLPTPSADPCATRGEATLYIFDVRDGTGFFTDGSGNPTRALAIGAGLPTDPKISVGAGGTDNRVYIEKSGADMVSIEQDDINTGGQLLYWRERR